MTDSISLPVYASSHLFFIQSRRPPLLPCPIPHVKNKNKYKNKNIGIFASDGANWKFQRRQASHIFNVKAFREYTSDVFVIEAQKVLEYLGKAADAGTEIDFHQLMLHFTLDSFGA
jgi:hypothetical protein